MVEENKNFRHLVRIANTDLDGNKRILQALRKIKGVSFMFANAVCNVSSIDKLGKIGYLTEQQSQSLDEILKNPMKYGIPIWMFNRRKDYETGEDRHLVTSDIAFVKDNDLKRLKMIRCYRGIRHAAGLPVRGQKTRSNFRKNKGKGSLGVKRNPNAKSGRT